MTASLIYAQENTMQYPVNGKVIREYSKGTNDGIDISGKAGNPVYAAASGRVAVITADADQIPIMVIRHPENVLTVYANVHNIRVLKGDKVSRGQQIAELSRKAPASMHFEVRKGFKSFDPMLYLRMKSSQITKTKITALQKNFRELSSDQRIQIQSTLKDSGFYKSSIDGLYGVGTKKALEAYNKQHLSGSDLTKNANAERLLSSLISATPPSETFSPED